MKTKFTPPPHQMPLGKRLLAGAIGAAAVIGLTQLMVLTIPESGNAFLRGWLQYGGVVGACIAAGYAAFDAPRRR